MASNRIDLRAVCSQGVKMQTNSTIPESGVVAWPVDVTRPFGDEANLGRFQRSLNINVGLELCHYFEGTHGDVIDLSRTPGELAYRPRMSVYVRVKKVQRSEALLPAGVDINLSQEESKLLIRLRQKLMPELTPTMPCPACNRVEHTEDEDAGEQTAAALGGAPTGLNQSSRTLMNQSTMNHSQGPHGSFMTLPVSELQIGVRRTAEIGVQVGNAGRVGGETLPVSFGTASRLREANRGAPASYSAGGPVLSGGQGFEFDDAASDLKRQVEEAVRERDVLKRQYEDVRQQKDGLEKWKREHRCEVSKEVSKLRDENIQLHEALRDLMRGREEVFARLQERRVAGSMLQDTPRPYAPFQVSVPAVDGSPQMRPSQLLADLSAAPGSTRRGDYSASRRHDDDDEDRSPPRSLLKRPSGAAATDVGVVSPNSKRDEATTKVASHTPGQALLRIASVTGEPFYVKRRLASQIREGGQHVFTLLSLDGVVTDEIHVSELELCSTEGPSGLVLATGRFSWALFMAPTERTQWLHWFYALNPFLSTERRDNDGVPNTA
jgi:hypothetical protein